MVEINKTLNISDFKDESYQFTNLLAIEMMVVSTPAILLIASAKTSFRHWLKANLITSIIFGTVMIIYPEAFFKNMVSLICI
jgi:hypothetical protein